MASKRVLFQSQARDKLLRGTTALADAVRVTLGPKSRSVLIDKSWGSPLVCNDGVTIAKEFELADAEENLGAKVLKQAAIRTGEQVGDGTSTATILAQALWSEGLRNVVAGASAIELKRGFDRGLRIAVDELKKSARPVTSAKERAQVATISAHNEASIGQVVADASERVGNDWSRPEVDRARRGGMVPPRSNARSTCTKGWKSWKRQSEARSDANSTHSLRFATSSS